MLSTIERNVVYLLLVLPPLTWGEMPSISSEQLKEELERNLGQSDRQACYDLFLLYDLENARASWLNNPSGPNGNYDEDDLKTRLVDYEGLPTCFAAYLDQYPAQEDRLKHFDELLRAYYLHLTNSSYPFIRFWGQLSLQFKEAFASIREGKGTTDELFHPFEVFYKEKTMKAAELADAINHFLFDQVAAYVGEDPFAIERVFAYIVQFYLIHLSIEVPT